MAARFPQYKYGGSPDDYVIEYYHENSGKFFKDLVSARAYAIHDAIKTAYVLSRGYPPYTRFFDSREYIDMACFYKSPQGRFLQESGPRKIAGFVSVVNEDVSKGKDNVRTYWIDRKKTESRVIGKDGRVIRKMTKKDWEEYY